VQNYSQITIKILTMTPEQILAKVFADIEQVKQEIQENPQTASMFLPALMEMFTKFGLKSLRRLCKTRTVSTC